MRESFVAVNAEVCSAIGADAVPVFGDEIGLAAEPVRGLGLVGEPTAVRARRHSRRRSPAGLIPVVAPLAVHPELGLLNVNADEAAAALAVGLGAERILFVTDVPGVLVDGDLVVDLPRRRRRPDARRRRVRGRHRAKLEAAVLAARGGVRAEIGKTEVVG